MVLQRSDWPVVEELVFPAGPLLQILALVEEEVESSYCCYLLSDWAMVEEGAVPWHCYLQSDWVMEVGVELRCYLKAH